MTGDTRRRDLALLVAWVGALYASLAAVRPVAEALRAAGVLTAVVALISLLVFGATLLLLRDRPGDRPAVPLPAVLLTALAAAWLSLHWTLPEERIHLAQYGPVGVLAWRALGGRTLAALALALVLGLVDEGIQGALSSRTFDAWDVFANGVAASAGVLLVRGGRGAWAAPALLLVARLVLGAAGPSLPAVTAPTPAAITPSVPTATFPTTSVLLVTIDALRADRVPPWGRAQVPTPQLDRLAAESLAVEQALANALWTTPSMVTLLTGLNPARHGVAGRGLELHPQVRTPLETLVDAGWSTHGFAGDGSETYRNLGFGAELGEAPDFAALFTQRAFVWMHLRDVHAPYDASPERLEELGLSPSIPSSPILDRARSHPTVPRADFPGDHSWLRPAIEALYDAEVADADAALGRVLDQVPEDVLVVLTADHGEELLERGGIGHASTTLESHPQPELLETPLLIRFPDRRRAGETQPGRMEQQDVMPTLMSLLGVPIEGPVDGRDLADALLSGGEIPPRPALIHSSACGWQCGEQRPLVHGWWADELERCAGPPATCPPSLREALERAAAQQVGTVRSPPPSQGE